MATWIKFKEVRLYPEVIKVYKRAGGGQGSGQGTYGATTPASGIKGFDNYVRKLFQDASNGLSPTLPAWLRAAPGSAPGDWQNSIVDVTAIPGVRKLRDNGKWTGFPN
jgi:hypothetical protein